LRSLDSFVSPQ